MAIYSTVIEPGHDHAYYEAYAQTAAPICSIVAGMPLLFAVAWWIGRHAPGRAMATAIALWACYMLLDVSILVAGDADMAALWLVSLISSATKLLAVLAGGRVGRDA